MKKNLRIVSVAAAALLAVAPVAASAVSTVNAATLNSSNTVVSGISDIHLNDGDKANVTPNVHLNTTVGNDVAASLTTSFSVNVNGTTATSTFKPGEHGSTVDLYWINSTNPDDQVHITDLNQVTHLTAGATYKVIVTNVGLNFGTQNANKNITISFPGDDEFNTQEDSNLKSTHEVKLDQNGTVVLPKVIMHTTAKNFANPSVVNWFNAETNAPVTSGNIELNAGADDGKMNVAQVIAMAKKKYYASNYGYLEENKESSKISYSDNLVEALKAAGVEVKDNWFVAPKSFTFNMTATANNNDASKTLAVTVNVPNGKEVTPATVPSQSKTVMHNAYFYDKDAKRVGTDKVTRYNTVTVAMNKTKFSNGIEYYEVVENNKLSGKFINADNIDGTKRTLKHNAYVYRSSKKRANKVVLKKGETVTTYGGSYTFKNGKKYYKIGNDTKKTYVKVANFD